MARSTSSVPTARTGRIFRAAASLSQFNGFRYLKYIAYLSTTDTTATPTVNDVTICYTTPRVWTGAVSSDWNNPANWSSGGLPGSSDAAIIPTAGVTNDPTNTSSVSVASLSLGSGRIVDTGGNTLTVNTCSPSAITGGSSTSYVKGSLIRCVDPSGTYLFPVGTALGYSPASLSGIAGTGNFSVTPVEAYIAGVDTAVSPKRYWSLTPISGVTSANISLTYLDADLPPSPPEASYVIIRNSAGHNGSYTPTTINTATNTFTLNGVSAFSDWTGRYSVSDGGWCLGFGACHDARTGRACVTLWSRYQTRRVTRGPRSRARSGTTALPMSRWGNLTRLAFRRNGSRSLLV